jgi:hypothetical protein
MESESGESEEDHSWDDDYVFTPSESSEDLDNESHNSEEHRGDYEEERPKRSYNFKPHSLRNYPSIEINIKELAIRKIREIETSSSIDRECLNHTLLFASIVILAKNGNRIDNRFSELCNEVIETVVKCDIDFEKVEKDKDNKIEQLKRDLLRYCRFVQHKV